MSTDPSPDESEPKEPSPYIADLREDAERARRRMLGIALLGLAWLLALVGMTAYLTAKIPKLLSDARRTVDQGQATLDQINGIYGELQRKENAITDKLAAKLGPDVKLNVEALAKADLVRFKGGLNKIDAQIEGLSSKVERLEPPTKSLSGVWRITVTGPQTPLKTLPGNGLILETPYGVLFKNHAVTWTLGVISSDRNRLTTFDNDAWPKSTGDIEKNGTEIRWSEDAAQNLYVWMKVAPNPSGSSER
jgi:hypothetical protein